MILDGVILAILLISAVVAFFRGFIKEVLTVIGLGGAAFGAFLFGGRIVPFFKDRIVHQDDPDYKFFDLIPDDMVALLAGYLAIFIVIFLILSVIGHFLSKGAAAMGLGPIDRSLGVLFGIFRGVVLVAILYLPFSLIMTGEEFPEFVKESRLIPVVDRGLDWTIDVAGLEKPLEELERKAAEDKNGDAEKAVEPAIDALRKEYIGKDVPKTDAAKEPTAPQNGSDHKTGYDSNEREAMKNLIEEGANE